MMNLDLQGALGIVIAALGGAAVGLERQWSGHASGAKARFAGIRTFTLLGLAAGLAGWMWSAGLLVFAGALMTAAAALIVAAYFAASRTEVDGTTEMAALVVLGAGVVAGMHELRLASALIAITALLLAEKSKLHSAIERIDDESLRAAFRFAVMAVVILPILPVGPFGPWGGVRPRQLWTMVLFFSGLSFAGYLARRALGSHRGYPVAGLLGGMISSTNVTFSFARASRKEEGSGNSLALGVVAACAVMPVRVLIATGILNSSVCLALVPFLVAPFVIPAVIAWIGTRKHKEEEGAANVMPSNPLQFLAALQMAMVFQVVLFAVRGAQSGWGDRGVLFSAGVLGLTDIDALVFSMAKGTGVEMAADVAARAIAMGVLSNTLLKMAIAGAVGVKRFRKIAVGGLCAVALACVLSLAFLR